MLGQSIVGWVTLFFCVVGFVQASVALKTGKIDVGWAFRSIVVERAKHPFLYWCGVCGCYFLVVFFFALVIYGDSFLRY